MAKHLQRLCFVFVSIISFFLFTTNVFAKSVTITSGMSEEEINEITSSLVSGDVVTIQPGNYSNDTETVYNHKRIKITTSDTQVVLNAGSYIRFQLITVGDTKVSLNGNVTMVGEASSVKNPAAALYVEAGEMRVNTNGYKLTITDYQNGVRMGHTNALGYEDMMDYANPEFYLESGSNLDINGCVKLPRIHGPYYQNYYDDGAAVTGEGWTGSAFSVFGNRETTITIDRATVNGNYNGGAGIYYANKASTLSTFNVIDSTLNFNHNASGYYTENNNTVNYFNIVNSHVSLSNNTANGYVGHIDTTINVKNSTLTVNDNGNMGINNAYTNLEDATVEVTNNHGHGYTNVALDAVDSTVTVNNNGYIGINITKYNKEKNSTDITNSTITANGNGGPGIRFYISNGITNITDSTIITNDDGCGDEIYGFEVKPGDSGYWAGVVAKGDLYAKNSTMMSNGVSGYALYDSSTGPATFHVLEDTVAVEKGNESKDIFDDYNSSKGNTGHTVVTGGSLQADIDNISTSDSLKEMYETNQNPTMPNGTGSKEDVQFAIPVNEDYTALTQFILHQDINKVVGGAGSHTFTYYDPYNGTKYDYTFRYNRLGEDLDATVFGRAYVWTPVSILRYDATEGFVNFLGTAGKITFGSGYTDGLEGLNTRYTQDLTIFGNSMNLAEKTLASAYRKGYVFLGWYIADDAELAKEYATNGDFEKLYALLNTEFTADTKLEIDGTPVSELTIYAKWDEESTGSTTGPEIEPPKTGMVSNDISVYILTILAMLGNASIVLYITKNN